MQKWQIFAEPVTYSIYFKHMHYQANTAFELLYVLEKLLSLFCKSRGQLCQLMVQFLSIYIQYITIKYVYMCIIANKPVIKLYASFVESRNSCSCMTDVTCWILKYSAIVSIELILTTHLDSSVKITLNCLVMYVYNYVSTYVCNTCVYAYIQHVATSSNF